MALQIEERPTVMDLWRKVAAMPPPPVNSAPLDAGWLRRLCFDTGADDVGLVEVERAESASQRAEIDALPPGTRTLIVLDAQRQRFNNQDLLAQSQTAVTTDLT